jgi:hypothetical protein
LAYQIVAVRDNETVRYERNSMLIAIAKARVWAREGWEVSITDDEGRTLESAEFERAFRGVVSIDQERLSDETIARQVVSAMSPGELGAQVKS